MKKTKLGIISAIATAGILFASSTAFARPYHHDVGVAVAAAATSAVVYSAMAPRPAPAYVYAQPAAVVVEQPVVERPVIVAPAPAPVMYGGGYYYHGGYHRYHGGYRHGHYRRHRW